MNDSPAADAANPSEENPEVKEETKKPRFDRSIVEGPLGNAVWKLAWPTMLSNVFGGLQGMADHAIVGNVVGFRGNAAIGVSWQIFLVKNSLRPRMELTSSISLHLV